MESSFVVFAGCLRTVWVFTKAHQQELIITSQADETDLMTRLIKQLKLIPNELSEFLWRLRFVKNYAGKNKAKKASLY
jgi:hypothetical protein